MLTAVVSLPLQSWLLFLYDVNVSVLYLEEILFFNSRSIITMQGIPIGYPECHNTLQKLISALFSSHLKPFPCKHKLSMYYLFARAILTMGLDCSLGWEVPCQKKTLIRSDSTRIRAHASQWGIWGYWYHSIPTLKTKQSENTRHCMLEIQKIWMQPRYFFSFTGQTHHPSRIESWHTLLTHCLLATGFHILTWQSAPKRQAALKGSIIRLTVI